MKNKKVVKSMLIGAVVGGIVAMIDRQTRTELIDNVKASYSGTKYYIEHPSTAVRRFRQGYDDFANYLSVGVNSTIKMLTQIEETLDALEKKNEN
ncbi:hypothetical protein [Aquibacillus salsiterrae]|uniref:YtxH domain-containing protein n=1 Tax=Aquibacillus salsiterrae TaxID=2950439 RepID=A0A9X3WGV9_9BACI|nr:hypothetical protein [Aquibacillus salsiterrae]MDC3418170.1 hypothetical protein [Aquibacillus salsiterrae]